MLSIITRIFSVLGLGIVSMGSLVVLINTAVIAAQEAWSGLGSQLLAWASLAGIPAALGLVVGAQVTVVGFQALKKLRFL